MLNVKASITTLVQLKITSLQLRQNSRKRISKMVANLKKKRSVKNKAFDKHFINKMSKHVTCFPMYGHQLLTKV